MSSAVQDDTLPVAFEKGDVKVERMSRLTCEHREYPGGKVEVCGEDASFAVTTADYGAPTRSRYCLIHVWDAIEEWMSRGDDDE